MSRIISHEQARKILQTNPRANVYFTTRDATLQHFSDVHVYLDEDAELRQPHPTDTGSCSVPSDVTLRVAGA
jgi:hypothetical protein